MDRADDCCHDGACSLWCWTGKWERCLTLQCSKVAHRTSRFLNDNDNANDDINDNVSDDINDNVSDDINDHHQPPSQEASHSGGRALARSYRSVLLRQHHSQVS